jgi:hypothetical protein
MDKAGRLALEETARRAPLEHRKARPGELLADSRRNSAERRLRRRRCSRLRTPLRAWVRRHRPEAPWLALPGRPIGPLAQDQEPRPACGEARSRGRAAVITSGEKMRDGKRNGPASGAIQVCPKEGRRIQGRKKARHRPPTFCQRHK